MTETKSMAVGATVRVTRDSDDLGLDRGTRLRVIRVHAPTATTPQTMDIETTDHVLAIFGVDVKHEDLELS